jgi:hypothetical protein
VVEAGEDLTLVAEAPYDAVGIHAALEDLDGHALLKRIVIADAQVDAAHAAVTDLADQSVWTDARALTEVEGGIVSRCGTVLVR